MKLSKQEQQMIQAMRIAEQTKSKEGQRDYKNVQGNLNSSLMILLSKARHSSNTKVKETADEVLKQIDSIGGIDNVSIDQYQELINLGRDAVKLDKGLSDDYGLVIDTAHIYNNGTTDEELVNITKHELEQAVSRNSYDDADKVIINEITGTKFVQKADGTVGPYKDSIVQSEEAKLSSHEAFINSGGVTQDNLFADTSLVEVSYEYFNL